MKKALIGILTVSVLAFAVSGCSSGGNGGDAGYLPPDMGSAAGIPDSGATRQPASGSEAAGLFLSAKGGLAAYFGGEKSAKAALSAGGPGNSARVINEVFSNPIVISENVGGGTVTGRGSYSASLYISDELAFFTILMGGATPNQSVLYRETNAYDLAATVTNVTLDDGSFSYLMSGKSVERNDSAINAALKTDSSGVPSFAGAYSAGLSYGYAFTILRSDGLGAKYLLSCAGTVSGAIESSGSMPIPEGTVTAILGVYDDDDELLYEIDITDELFAAALSFEK